MSSVENDLNAFNQFARNKIAEGMSMESIDALFDAWRVQNPPSEDLLAIKASLRDLDAGERGKPIEEFNTEIAEKHKLR